MKVVAIIKEDQTALIEVSQQEIAHIMGVNSIYSNPKLWMSVGKEIPISEQYYDVQRIESFKKSAIELKKQAISFLEMAEKNLELSNKLTYLKTDKP